MKNKLFLTGILTIILVFGLAFIGCDDTIEDEKTIDSRLVGKWEWEKLVVGGDEYNFPIEGMNSGGYKFTSNTFTSYLNGSEAASFSGMYTENNRIYAQNGQAGYTYSISGNKLTAMAIDGSSGVIANKVTNFSWE